MRPTTLCMPTILVLLLSSPNWRFATAEAVVAPQAPAFEIITAGGETLSNTTLKGRPALLVFWAPWCKICQQELPDLAVFYQNSKPEALRMVSIGFADLRSNVETFVKDRPDVFVYPNAYDEDRWLAQTFHVNATPTYVALDPEGRIVLVHRGGGVLKNPRFQEFLSVLRR